MHRHSVSSRLNSSTGQAIRRIRLLALACVAGLAVVQAPIRSQPPIRPRSIPTRRNGSPRPMIPSACWWCRSSSANAASRPDRRGQRQRPGQRSPDLPGHPLPLRRQLPDTGFDCSGLVSYTAQRSLGLKLPATPPRSPSTAPRSTRTSSRPAIWCSSTRWAAAIRTSASTWVTTVSSIPQRRRHGPRREHDHGLLGQALQRCPPPGRPHGGLGPRGLPISRRMPRPSGDMAASTSENAVGLNSPAAFSSRRFAPHRASPVLIYCRLIARPEPRRNQCTVPEPARGTGPCCNACCMLQTERRQATTLMPPRCALRKVFITL